MRGLISAFITCALLTAAAGCGSSSSSTKSTPASSTSTAARAGPRAITTPNYGTPAASAPLRSGTVQVAYRNITIAPDTLKVKVGTTIRWTNDDPIEHNVTSRGGPQKFASKNLGEGGTYQITVTKPGVIHYICTIHPVTMNGTIVVVK